MNEFEIAQARKALAIIRAMNVTVDELRTIELADEFNAHVVQAQDDDPTLTRDQIYEAYVGDGREMAAEEYEDLMSNAFEIASNAQQY